MPITITVHLAEKCTWKTVFLIPKRTVDFLGIGLVEVLWKTVMGILNFHVTAVIQLHDTLHGFRTVRSTGTIFLEVNLLQQMKAMKE